LRTQPPSVTKERHLLRAATRRPSIKPRAFRIVLIRADSRGHFKSSLKQTMIQARMQKASYIMASLSQRTIGLLKLPSRANVLSTHHLPLELIRPSFTPAFAAPPRGYAGDHPLRRSQPRKRSQSYALSATSFLGLFLGRPLPHGTRTRSKVSWARFTSGRPGRWRAPEESRSHPPPASASSPSHLGHSDLFSLFCRKKAAVEERP